MLAYGLIQSTTVIILLYNWSAPANFQYMYWDAVISVGLSICMSMTDTAD